MGCLFFEKLFYGAAACAHWISSIKDIDNDIGGIDDLMLIPIPAEKKKTKKVPCTIHSISVYFGPLKTQPL